jgi:hypothetical protein
MHRYCLPALAAALVASAFVLAAFAQPAPRPDVPPPGTYEQNEGPPRIESYQRPLFAASSLEVSQSGGLTTVRVRGMASSSGWQEPVLVRLVRGVPSDGVLDLLLVAEPPPEAMQATGFASTDAVLLVEQNHPYRAVRVRSATNVLTLHALSGGVEAAIPVDDCDNCVGQPLATCGADAISRHRLPKETRILSPTEPFTDVRPDPNRLTLLIGDDGKII